ncbi:MAG: type II CAAX endopeptidase family protein [Saprospiraceae bacterium]
MKSILRILTLFILSIILGVSISIILNGFSIENLNSEKSELSIISNTGVDLYILLSQSTTILLPALLFLIFFHRSNIANWIKINPPKQSIFFVLSILFLFMAYPLIEFSAGINSKLQIAEWMQSESKMAGQITKMILTIDSPLILIVRILLIGLLPAIGEELYFRAGIQNELIKSMKNPDIAIVISAILFSAFHMQFDGFLPRFFLGLMLGYLYFWSKSILVPILVHFINNSMLVVSAYLMQDKIDEISNNSIQQIPTLILILSMIAIFMLRSLMIRLKQSEQVISDKNEYDE